MKYPYTKSVQIDANFKIHSFESQKLQLQFPPFSLSLSSNNKISLIQTLKNPFPKFSINRNNQFPPSTHPSLTLTSLLRFSNATKCLNTAR